MADDTLVPVGWTAMTSKQVGSDTRDTNEPGGSRLLISFDAAAALNLDDPMELDFMDFGLPSLKASAYSTALLAQKKWMTMGVSRIVDSDQISGSIECAGATYGVLMGLIGAIPCIGTIISLGLGIPVYGLIAGQYAQAALGPIAPPKKAKSRPA